VLRAAAVSLLLLAALAFGQEERARELAAASAKEVDKNPELAVMLAREALAAADIEPARTALYAALLETCRCTVLAGHEGAVSCGDISPDGQLVATGSEDGTARLWTPAGQQTAALAAGAPVREVRFVGSERVMVATDAALALWDRAGQKLAEFPPSPHLVTAGGLLLLPEGQVQFVGGDGKVLREMAAVRGGTGAGGIAFHAFTADGRVRWYDLAGKEKAIKPAAGTSRIAFAASGTLIATWGGGKVAELWSPEGKKLGELAHGGPVEQVAISATGGRIVSAADDGQYSIWTGEARLTRRIPKRGPCRFLGASSPVGIWVALSGDDDVTLSYPTLDSGDEIVAQHVGVRVHRIEPNATGHGIRVDDEDGTPRFLFWTTLKEVNVRNSLRGELTVSRWGNRGDWQAYGDDKGKVSLHHWRRAPSLGLRGHTGAILHVSFSADDRRLLTTSRDGTARLWEIDSPDMMVFYHPRNGVSGVGYGSGTSIVTIDWTAAHIWDRDGRHIRSLEVPKYFAGWSAGDAVAIAGQGDTAARLFSPTTGKEIGQLRHDGAITWLTRSWPKLDRFATYSAADHTARIWDATGKRRALMKHPAGVLVAAFGTDGSLLTIAEDSHVRIWSSGGSLQGEFQVPGQVASFLRSPKLDRILTSHEEARTLRLWTSKGKEIVRLVGHKGPAAGWSFSWQGDEILTTSEDGTARLWDKDGRPGKVIAHPKRVGMGMFLPERDGFVTGCDDGLVRHWDRDGNLHAVMAGHKDYGIVCADYTDDGAFLATGADDGIVRVWPLKRDDLLRIAKERVTRELTAAERGKYADLLTK
jgi:WD40 repeat protein